MKTIKQLLKTIIFFNREELAKCLLIEDEILLQYSSEKSVLTTKLEESQAKLENALDQITELNAKLQLYEASFVDITKKNPDSMESRLANQTKRLALLDVNLIRLARKYDCLREEEKNLRESYFKLSKDAAEKEE